jgi:hypothetical protein
MILVADCSAPVFFRMPGVAAQGKKMMTCWNVIISSFEIEEGKLPRRALNLVLDWAELHRDELLSDWDKCRAHQQPDKIEPLT